MSLVQRMTIIVALILAVGGSLAGIGIYRAVRQAREADLKLRIGTRFAWIESCIGRSGSLLTFQERQEPEKAAQFWTVSASDGRLLWKSPDSATPHRGLWQTHLLQLDPSGGKATLETIGVGAMSEGKVPDGVLDEHPSGNFKAYNLTSEAARVHLNLSAGASTHEMDEEMERLSQVLWTVGLGSLIFLGTLLALMLRWQLAPLASMSRQASHIGPKNVTARIEPTGSAIEYVRLRDAINQMLQRLGDGLERERRFASMAAHELRTPLAQLKAGVEVSLRKERSPEEYIRVLRDALADAERLERLVSGLLHLTRATCGADQHIEPLDLSELIERAMKRGADAPIKTGTWPQGGICVLGNPELFMSAMRNVLENARLYAGSAPPELSLCHQDGNVTMIIADRGPGVPIEKREEIFEPLTRLDPARTMDDPVGGFGLGLAIARSTLRLFEGDLFCRSRSDGQSGTEFVFVFKRVPQPNEVSSIKNA